MKRMNDEPHGLLQKALLANAVFSSISGLAIVFSNHWLVRFLGLPSQIDLTVLGVGLMVYAVLLEFSARRRKIIPSHAWIAVSLDLLWVAGSYLLLLLVRFSTDGKWLVIVVAELVLVFAALQWFGIRRIRRAEQYV